MNDVVREAQSTDLRGAEATIAETNPAFAADLVKAKNLPEDQQTYVNNRVAVLTRGEAGMSAPDALATALGEVPHLATRDEIMEFAEDTPEANANRVHSEAVARSIREQQVTQLADEARRFAQPSDTSISDRFV